MAAKRIKCRRTPARVLLINAIGEARKLPTYAELLSYVTAQVQLHWPGTRDPVVAAEAILATPLWDFVRELTLIDLITLAQQKHRRQSQ